MERLRAHPLLTFTEPDHKGVCTATWGVYKITGNDRIAWHIDGSIHRDYFGGKNWQDFDRAMFNAAVDHLCGSLGLHDAALTIEGIEIGVNITPTEETALILDSVKSHRRAIAKRMDGPDAVGLVIAHAGKKNKRPNYRWKIYDKAHQYRLLGRLLRVELAHNQTAPIRARGITTLAHLRTAESWAILSALLRTRFDELHIVEPYTDTAALRPAQAAIVALATQPRQWVKLSGAQLCRKAKALEGIYTAHASPRIRPALRELIHAKLNELNTPGDALPVTKSPGVRPLLPVTKSPGGLERLPVTDPSFKVMCETITGNAEGMGKGEHVPADAFGGVAEVVGTPDLSIVSLRAVNEVTTPEVELLESTKKGEGQHGNIPGPPCATCGRPTGSTAKKSKFCSPSFYGQREAKKCRNADSNARHNAKNSRARSIAKITSGGVLFDQTPYLKPQQPAALNAARI